jgi:hypothetical protein
MNYDRLVELLVENDIRIVRTSKDLMEIGENEMIA